VSAALHQADNRHQPSRKRRSARPPSVMSTSN